MRNRAPAGAGGGEAENGAATDSRGAPDGRSASPAFPRTRWHLWLDLSPRPGALNMAIDQTLLERAARLGEHRLRLYRWQPYCLSFGRHERALERYDRGRISASGLDVVRRPTGGRAVWHAGELTYAVALPTAGLSGVRAAFLEIHRMLLEALRALGIEAGLAPPSPVPALDGGACFARAVGGEILVRGRKVVGSAQLREGGGLLQHGSILLRDDQAVVRTFTLGVAPPDGSAALERLLGAAVPPADVANAIAGAAAARWGGEWIHRESAPALLAEAARHGPRFASAEWTWRA